MSRDVQDYPCLASGKDGFAVKKLLLFVLAIALVSTLSASIGCGGKKTTAGGTATTTTPVTASTKTP
jgi:hypothetical protein